MKVKFSTIPGRLPVEEESLEIKVSDLDKRANDVSRFIEETLSKSLELSISTKHGFRQCIDYKGWKLIKFLLNKETPDVGIEFAKVLQTNLQTKE